jgi:hypothetical protein
MVKWTASSMYIMFLFHRIEPQTGAPYWQDFSESSSFQMLCCWIWRRRRGGGEEEEEVLGTKSLTSLL